MDQDWSAKPSVYVSMLCSNGVYGYQDIPGGHTVSIYKSVHQDIGSERETKYSACIVCIPYMYR